jgi:hypothetical protein
MKYVYQEYPKMVNGRTVNSAEEEAALNPVEVVEMTVTNPVILNSDGTVRRKPGRPPKVRHDGK